MFENFRVFIIIAISLADPSLQLAEQNRFECPYLPKCACNRTQLICDNFDRFSELNFKLLTNDSIVYDLIIIRPRLPQKLSNNPNERLDLSGLSVKSGSSITVSNINSFDVLADPLSKLNNIDNRYTLSLAIKDSKLNFVYKEKPLNDICKSYDSLSTNQPSILGSANIVTLDNVIIEEPLCPLVFKNAKITSLIIKNPIFKQEKPTLFLKTFFDPATFSSTIIKPVSPRLPEATILNSRINFLTIESANIDNLNENFLDNDVFFTIKTLSLSKVSINSISPTVFSFFKYFKQFKIEESYLKKIISNDLTWLYNLKKPIDPNRPKLYSDKYKNFNKFKLMINTDYNFPEEDICKFEKFPFDHVTPYISILGAKKIECTCTLIWILKDANSNSYDLDFSSSSGTYGHCVNDASLNSCNINKKCFELQAQKAEMLADSPTSDPVPMFQILFLLGVLIVFIAFSTYFINRMSRNCKKHGEYNLANTSPPSIEMASMNTSN